MKKSILEIYAMAACLFTIVCLVASLGVAAYAALGIAAPEFTMRSWTSQQHETNDSFWGEKEKARPGETELTRKRLESLARASAAERRDNIQTLVKSLDVTFIALVVFALHWRMARRARLGAAQPA